MTGVDFVIEAYRSPGSDCGWLRAGAFAEFLLETQLDGPPATCLGILRGRDIPKGSLSRRRITCPPKRLILNIKLTRTLVLRFVAPLLAAFVAACSSQSITESSSARSSASEPAPPAAGEAIKIGIDFPVSGGDASNGIPTQNGAVLAIEEANAAGIAGGRFKVTPILLDDAVRGLHDPAAGAQNVKTFIADSSVLGIIGPFNSNVAKAEIPLTNDAGIAQISPSTTADVLTVGAAANALRSSHPGTNTYFRVCANDMADGDVLARFAKKLGFTKAFIIDDNETYGRGLAESFESHFTRAGGIALGHDHITAGQQDFKPLLTKIKALSPSVVFFGGTTSTGGGLIRRQMGDVGMSDVGFMGGGGISDPGFLAVAGTMANGTYFSVPAPDVRKLASAKAFVKNYNLRFKQDVGNYSANAYTAAKVLITAIERAAADRGKIPTRAEVVRNVAATTRFASPIGRIGFDQNGDVLDPILTLRKVNDGKVVTVEVLALKKL